jgi:hypothetical protein
MIQETSQLVQAQVEFYNYKIPKSLELAAKLLGILARDLL